MKKKIILLSLVSALIYVLLVSYIGGPALVDNFDATGSTSAAPAGCNCHNPASTATTTVALQLLSGATPVTTYIAGHTYTVQITGTQTSAALTLPKFGFQIAVVQAAGAGTAGAINEGTFSGAPVNTHLQLVGSINIFEHAAALAATTGTGGSGTTYVQTITWTAPAAGTGSVKMLGVINAVNGNGTDDAGDKWNSGNATITELSAITGPSTVCQGANITLTDVTGGGTWSSSSSAIATVGTSGIVHGVSGGTATISYTLGGSSATQVVTVNPLPTTPAAISGTARICGSGVTTSLSDVTGGGVWSSTNTTTATVGTSGIVTAGSVGTTTISYTVTNSCGSAAATAVLTVNATPTAAVSNNGPICTGGTVNLTATPAGGATIYTWAGAGLSSTSVQNPIATPVTSTIYTLSVSSGAGAGCSPATLYTTAVTVSAPPTTVATNSSPACIGGTVNLNANATSTSGVLSYLWSGPGGFSDVTATPILNSVAPANAGTYSVTITTPGSGCSAGSTTIVTVNPLPSAPAAISGTAAVCAGGATTTLSDVTTGGVWSSTAPGTAAVGTSGIITSGTAGTATISYTLTNSCGSTAATIVVTVNSFPVTPAVINGAAIVCTSDPAISLSDITAGGTWSSTNTTTATIGSTGIVTAGSAGTTTISYTLANSCGSNAVTMALTVNSSPATITGTTNVCAGSTTALSDGTPGGTWSSSNTTNATVGTAGLLSGLFAGTSVISYIAANGCATSVTENINPLPSAISGTGNMCAGSVTILSDIPSTGSWSSSNTAVATAGTFTGIISALAVGSSVISYTLPTGCATTLIATVNPAVSAISGSANVCVGLTTTLSDAATPGGTWSSSNTTNVTIGSTGFVSGLVVGTSLISYTAPTGCVATLTENVNPLPSAISGAAQLCVGSSTILTDIPSTGSWSSSNTAIATAGTFTGIISAISVGTATITYTLPTGCVATFNTTVNPAVGAISGSANVCIGLTTPLSDATPGGTWSSSNTTNATVGSAGLVSGLVAGTSTISYTSPIGCVVTLNENINPLPSAISGAAQLCVGSSTILTDIPSTGSWSSSNTAIATAGTFTGIISAISVGTATITYTLPTGCIATFNTTVNPAVSAISGSANVCIGLTTPLSDATPGGTWSSSNTTNATVGSAGLVSGLVAGTSTISYTSPIGCVVTLNENVNPLPSAISGAAQLCVGSTTILTDIPSTGSWSSSNTAIATAGTFTGIISAISVGTTTITYTLPTGCIATFNTTVNPAVGAISGSANVCIGLTTPLSDATPGGTWSSSNTTNATVGSAGLVSGLVAGTSTISYTSPIGCVVTLNENVNPLPSAISGAAQLCVGSTTILTDIPSTGSWSSSNTVVATVGTFTGIISAIAVGTATITYTLPTGCIATFNTTVNPAVGAISGSANVCIGLTTPLSDATPGGTWSSSNTTNATVGSAGLVSGLVAGTSTISYTSPIGCIVTLNENVNPLPSAISGAAQLCVGSTTILTDIPSTGSWSSSNTAVATAGTFTGIISAISVGTATITYTLPTGCIVTFNTTVNPAVGPISGSANVCIGLTTPLSDATPGGTWSSSNTTNATVGSTGLVSGLVAGSSTISYTSPIGCVVTLNENINPLPSVISGAAQLCVGSSTILTDIPSTGSWSSSNTAIATAGTFTGIISAIAVGTATITYTLPTGCIATFNTTVNPAVGAISGSANVCIGLTTPLSDATPGGTWSSSNTTNATVGSTGLVSGLVAGISSISYTSPIGCVVTLNENVNPLPSAISGAAQMCVGSATILTDIPSTGSWSSSNTAVATAGTFTGIISAITVGTATITYTLPTGCIATFNTTVNPAVGAISGSANVCIGLTTPLSDATPGGTWSSSNTTNATVGSAGLVSGLVAGNSTISYTSPIGCVVTLNENVNPLPSAISGAAQLCVGSTTILTDIPSTGSWSSSNTAIATAGTFTGIISAISVGTATITYTLPTGCIATFNTTVNPAVGAISGSANVCIGLTTPLSDATPGGTWSSSNTTNATVGSTGLVSGLVAGTSTISYTSPIGCVVTLNENVNPLPSAISGATQLCVGSTTILTDIPSTGSWSSSNTAIATAGTFTGIISAIAVGTATITYTLPTGCVATFNTTVNPAVGAISGSANVCIGLTTPLSDATPGGTWSSSNTTNATVGSAGLVSGLVAGTSTISYTSPIGCVVTLNENVNPLPSAISGAAQLCVSSSTILTDIPSTGSWSSSNTAIATAGTFTGIISAISVGTATITYTLPTGCIATFNTTVNPAVGPIIGSANVCIGLTTPLSDATPGGTWSSSNTTNATVGSTGLVSGLVAGTSTISYTSPIGCVVTLNENVNPLPSAISGAAQLCVGSTTILTDIPSTGSWSSSNTAIATAGTFTGIISAISVGTATITYTLPTGCIATFNTTVNPAVGPIIGSANVCIGLTTPLSDATPGGTWSSSNTTNATVGSTGLVSGLVAGTSTISYTSPIGCVVTLNENVNPLPSAISGAAQLCVGSTTILTDIPSTGSWSSSNTAIATAGTFTGIISAIAVGTATITYTLPTGCVAKFNTTVNPAVGAISGSANVCIGLTTPLSDATPGGTWSSSNTTNATVGSAGLVSGLVAGTSTISYTSPIGCVVTLNENVNPLPSAISGAAQLCVGSTTILTDIPSTGSWSSSNTAIATAGTFTGIISAIAVGTATITYTLPTGCIATFNTTVNPAVGAISGSANVCIGLTTPLSDATPGGTWSSSNTTNATVGSTGLVSGLVAGTSTISYTSPIGCVVTLNENVNPLPSAISGAAQLCVGSTTILTDIPSTGSWSSSNAAVATAGTFTGIISAIAVGTATITYTLPTGCIAKFNTTVNPAVGAISGSANVCIGLTTPLSDATPGGTWSSSNTTNATVGSAGLVSGLVAGTSTISYTSPIGCVVTLNENINPLPSAISGTAQLCVGSTTILTDIPSTGSWSSSNTAIATAGTFTGIISAISVGTATITYTLPTGCIATFNTTVNPAVGAISGSANVCIGLTTPLSDATPGGTWSSSNTTNATVGSTGLVSGLVAGTSTISYTSPIGCVVTLNENVNPLPSAISGAAQLCVGSATILTDIPSTGSWSSSNTAIATAGTFTGIISAISIGTATITYTLPTGCIAKFNTTVNPAVSAISGSTNVCIGLTTPLSDATPGGTWSSSNTTNATVGSAGLVSGLVAGTSTISYTSPIGCVVTLTENVNPLPSAISGAAQLCVGSTTILTDIPSTGSWSSSNTAIATAGTFTGIISAISVGTATITYTLPTGCIAKFNTTVNPAVSAISGSANVCIGLTTPLSDATPGGTWSSSNTTNATVGSAGLVSGLVAGTSTISYTSPIGCVVTLNENVNPLPSAISGAAQMCAGSTSIFTDIPSTGSWSSSNTSVATAGTFTGIISAIAVGTATITYSLPTGCIAKFTTTVNPAVGAISGLANVCIGLTTPLSDATPGGTWSSSNTTNATVGSTGLVSGLVAGITVISYATSAGCMATLTENVSALPSAISGAAHMCVGSTTILSDIPSTGSWSSSNTSVAAAGTYTGIITGVGVGTAVITYALPTGCLQTMTETVNALPAAITGTTNVCVGLTTTLSDPTPGGTWSSGNITDATVGSLSGVVTGLVSGTSAISYIAPTGCVFAATVFINPLPSTISGATRICAGSATILSDIPNTGSWSSGNTSVATAGTYTGIITGISAGTAMITYKLPTGCLVAMLETVNPLPFAGVITGPSGICLGVSIALSDSTAGGVWSTTNGFASVSSAGSVTGITPGIDTVLYSVTNICGTNTVRIIDTVFPVPNAGTIIGRDSICRGDTLHLGNFVTGGEWISSNANAVVSVDGLVTGVTPGIDTISYIVSNICGADTARLAVVIRTIAACAASVNGGVVIEEGVIKVYPNPNNGIFTIEIPEPYTQGIVTITDVLGKVVETLQIEGQKVQVSALNINNIAPGNYFIKVNTGDKIYRGKITVIR